jgi:preprotein translocase subunit SecG
MKKSLWTITIVLSALFITSQIVIGCGGKKEQSAEEHEHAEGDTTNHHHDEMEMDSTEMDHD